MEESTKLSAFQGYNINLKYPIKSFNKLHRASWLGLQDEVRSCLKTMPINCKDSDMRTPLHLAAAAGHTLIVRILMENDLNFNDTDIYGKTAIMKAIECCHKDTVKAMIARGADLTAADRHGNNAMHMAILRAQYDIAQIMLKYFPNCNVGNLDGVTPFHMVAEGIQVKLARKFIDYGASVNCLDNRGRSPLMLASKRGCFPMVVLFLKHGANPQLKDHDGWGPVDYASIMGHTRVKDLLEKYIRGEISLDSEKESESSSTDEEETTAGPQCFVQRSSQRVVPIRIESHSMFLRRQKRLSVRRQKELADVERRPEGVRNADGTLLSMPDVVAAMQCQANKLGDIHVWLLKHGELIENKRKDYDQLKQQAKKLWEQRKKLLEKQEEQKKKLADLAVRQESAISIKEAEYLQEAIDNFKYGLAELREEHDKAVAERDELKRILQEGSDINKTTGLSMEQKTVQLLKENEMLYKKLDEIQAKTRNVTEDLTSKCKTADTLINHIKILLRGTYKLLEEKHGEVNKTMKEVDDQQEVINNTAEHFNNIKAENAVVGQNITQVDAKMRLVKKFLGKIHKEMENHPLMKSLIDAGVLDGKEAAKRSKDGAEVDIIKKKKTDRHELDAEPEVQLLADQKFDLNKLMSSTTTNAPTVCQSILENVRYSWLEGDEDNTSEVGEHDFQLLLDKDLPDDDSSNKKKLEELSNNVTSEDGQTIPPQLEAKLNLVAAKYSR